MYPEKIKTTIQLQSKIKQLLIEAGGSIRKTTFGKKLKDVCNLYGLMVSAKIVLLFAICFSSPLLYGEIKRSNLHGNLSRAMTSGDLDGVGRLLENNNSYSKNNVDTLYSIFIQNPQVKINQVNSEGDTLLHLASARSLT